jgi:glutamate synthase (NADPH/NADH) small chain
MDYGQEEAEAVQGEDPRSYLVNTERFIKDEAGNLSGIEIVNIEWKPNPEGGRPLMHKLEDTRRVLPCELALLALGFRGPESTLAEALKLETDARSNFKAEHEVYTTNVDKVFACGDCRRGQSLVVWAINEGRGCAREVDRFLMGSTQLP